MYDFLIQCGVLLTALSTNVKRHSYSYVLFTVVNFGISVYLRTTWFLKCVRQKCESDVLLYQIFEKNVCVYVYGVIV